MDTCLILQRSHGIMAEPAAAETATATSSISSSDDEDFSSSSSSSSDEMDDHAATSSPSKKGMHDGGGPLYEMSSLAVQIPFKRGLSKYYQGKSQTFTSLSNVRCLEDLAKPERPLRKKMKPCKSYACFLSPKDSSKSITKKASSSRLGSSSSTSSSSSLAAKKHQFVSGRHLIIPAHRSTNFDSTQAQPLLFA